MTSTSNTSALSRHLASATFVAGGAAGCVSRTVVSPLERLKIILQVQGKGSQAYHGVLPSLARMWREEGWRGFFRGNGINCVRIAPYSAVQFTAYEQMKRLITVGGKHEMTTPWRLTAGAAAGICSVAATYPLDLVRSRLSIATASLGATEQGGKSLVKEKMGMSNMTLKVYREEGGLRALYRGIVPTAVGVAPYVGCNFAFYELLRGYMVAEDGSIGVFPKLCCGGMAGAISQSLTYPLDVLRRKMQTCGMSEMHLPYNSAMGAIQVIFREEGIRGFYRGLWVNLLKVGPAIGTSFVTFEFVRGLLDPPK